MSSAVGPTARRKYAVIAVAAVVSALVAVPAAPAAAAECTTAGPSDGTYTVTVCLTSPAAGETVSGDATVAASVTRSAGGAGINFVSFSLDGEHLLSDYEAPFAFRLPTSWWVDGRHVLTARSVHWDGYTSGDVDRSVTFANGVTAPPPPPPATFAPRGSEPVGAAPLVVAATGDAAGGRAAAAAVSDLVVGWRPDVFLYLGDVYNNGSRTEFDNWYGRSDSLFGRLKDVTNPTVGNHEYGTPGAAGYKAYWGGVPSAYSYDRGGWHFVSLDSTTDTGQVAPGTQQYEWLRQDLAASPRDCTLVYFHHPVRSIGKYSADARLADLWRLLAEQGVDLVVTGHDHNYQRWAPLDGDGSPAPGGTTQLVAGGGGHGIHAVTPGDPRVLASSATAPQSYGALRLELTPAGGAYRYVSADGSTLDSSDLTCSRAVGDDTTAPAAPTSVTATAQSDGTARLTWAAGTDDRGVVGYDVLRDGVVVTRVSGTSHADAPAPGAHRYQLRAVDAAGNASPLSPAVDVTTLTALVFADGFDTGDLRLWPTATALGVATVPGATAGSAARPVSSGAASWARAPLPAAYDEVTVRARVLVTARGSNSCWLKLQRSGASVADLCTDANGGLYSWNYGLRTSVWSRQVVPVGSWHDVELRLRTGPSGSISVRYDGVELADMSRTAAYGTAPGIDRVQLGMEESGKSYDLAVDDVRVLSSAAVGAEPAPATGPSPSPSPSPSPVPSPSPSPSPVPSPSPSPVPSPSPDPVPSPTPTTPAPPPAVEPLFRDGFESNGFSHWTSSTLMSVVSTDRWSGSFAARALSTGQDVFARRSLGGSYSEVWSSTRVKVVSKGSKEVFLLKVRTPGGGSLAGVYASSKGLLGFKNEVGVRRFTSTVRVADGQWHLVEMRTRIAGASSVAEVWLDGALVPELSRTESLGTTGVGVVQIGESTASGASDVLYDDVWADTRPRP